MPKSKLPTKKFKKKAVIVGLSKKSQFPSIFRTITELPGFSFLPVLNRWAVVGFVSGILLMGIIITGVSLWQNNEALAKVKQERARYVQEVAFWKRVVDQYDGYRDGYFKLALLTYQLGEKTQARSYLQKAMELDPNFQEGRAFAQKLGS
ncbi:MAG: hypothetical protein HY428_00530 [Candidatus Levybacteria bacterium]|nr:hypothetical protein [Candidatus Levybacteria bacterium]